MKDYEKTKIFVILLAGFLTCLMVSLLYLGGGINLKCFLGAEKVYDFPKEDLTKTSEGFEYHGDAEGYSIVGNDAQNQYRVGRGTGKWKYLYITIDKMNVPVLHATLAYYNKEKELLSEQSVALSAGENIISLEEEGAFYRLGIRIRDAEGTFFSIQSMQARSEVNGFTPKRFAKAMGASCGAFLLVFAVGMYRWRKKRKTRRSKPAENPAFIRVLQGFYCVPGNFFGARFKGRLTNKQREWLFGGSFLLLFLCVLTANAAGVEKGEHYRYFALASAALLILAALLLWEKPLAEVNWRNPLALSWCGLWIFVIISDIFVDSGNKFIGYLMLFAAGFFLFSWNQAENPGRVLGLMMRALEVCFVLAVIFCALFRQEKTTVYYNGSFRNPDEMAMYSLLMFGVFLAELCGAFQKKGSFRAYVFPGCGAAASLYLTLRSGGGTAYTALGVMAAAVLVIKISHWVREGEAVFVSLKEQLPRLFFAAVTAVAVTGVLHMALHNLPEMLGTDVQMKDEQLISRLSSDELALYQLLLPEELKNVISGDELEIGLYQKSYARMIGLVGNIKQIYVYREPVNAYNGYLAVMYRYGIYAVLPFLLYQIYAVCAAVENCRKEDGKEHVWILTVDIVYIAFCIGGNAQITLSSPLTWCFFLVNGYGFFRKS